MTSFQTMVNMHLSPNCLLKYEPVVLPSIVHEYVMISARGDGLGVHDEVAGLQPSTYHQDPFTVMNMNIK